MFLGKVKILEGELESACRWGRKIGESRSGSGSGSGSGWLGKDRETCV
jgi:hypothetical protein